MGKDFVTPKEVIEMISDAKINAMWSRNKLTDVQSIEGLNPSMVSKIISINRLNEAMVELLDSIILEEALKH